MKNSKKIKTKYIVIFAVVFSAILLIAVGEIPRTTYYEIETDEMSADVRLALVSDLHACFYGGGAASIIRKIDKDKPDIVLLAGDIFDDRLPEGNAKKFLDNVSKKYKCFYVTGNHEYWSDDTEEMVKYVKDVGITVLEGDCETIEINGQTINVCGIDDPDGAFDNTGHDSFDVQLQRVATLSDNGLYSILLTHRPELTYKYKNYSFDLILAGHAHGGQWRIPGIVEGVYAPNQGFLPEYTAGEYKVGDGTMIVSRGLARISTPLPRVFNNPEIVMIDLK